MKINAEIKENDRMLKTPSGKEYYLLDLTDDLEKQVDNAIEYLLQKTPDMLTLSEEDMKLDPIRKVIFDFASKDIKDMAQLAAKVVTFTEKLLPQIEDISQGIIAASRFMLPTNPEVYSQELLKRFARYLMLSSKYYLDAARSFENVYNKKTTN